MCVDYVRVHVHGLFCFDLVYFNCDSRNYQCCTLCVVAFLLFFFSLSASSSSFYGLLWSVSVSAVAAVTQKVGRVISKTDTPALLARKMSISINFRCDFYFFFFLTHMICNRKFPRPLFLMSTIIISLIQSIYASYFTCYFFCFVILYRRQRQKKTMSLNLSGVQLNRTLYWAVSFGVM